MSSNPPEAKHQSPRPLGQERLGESEEPLAACLLAQGALAGRQHYHVGVKLPGSGDLLGADLTIGVERGGVGGAVGVRGEDQRRAVCRSGVVTPMGCEVEIAKALEPAGAGHFLHN